VETRGEGKEVFLGRRSPLLKPSDEEAQQRCKNIVFVLLFCCLSCCCVVVGGVLCGVLCCLLVCDEHVIQEKSV